MPVTEINNDVGEILRLKDEIKSLQGENKRLKADVSRAQAGAQVAALVFGVDGDSENVKDIWGRIDQAGWAMKDGKPTMLDEKGAPRSYVGPEEWVKELKSKAGHLFAQTEKPAQSPPQATTTTQPTGGGQQSGGQGDLKPGDLAPGEVNPWLDAYWNDTQQVLIIRADRARADRLARAAGTRVGALPAHLRSKTV